MRANSIVGWGKNNLASVCVEDVELPIVLSYTLKDSKVLSTPINKISRSKEVLNLYGRVQGYTDELILVQCVCTGYIES